MSGVCSGRRALWALLIAGMLAGCMDTTAGGGSTTETGNTLAVRILGPDGRPAAGVEVLLRRSDYVAGEGGDSITWEGRTRLDTVTGKDGRISAVLAPGRYVATALAASGAIHVEQSTGASETVDTLRPVGALRVPVRPALPCTGRILGSELEATGDTSGWLRFDSLPSGTLVLEVDADSDGVALSRRVTVVVVSGGLDTLDTLELRSAASETASGWTAARTAFLDLTTSGVAVSRDQDSFPLPLCLRGSRFDSIGGEGSDLRFLDGDGASLSWDREAWSGTAARGDVWVLLPTIEGNSAQSSLTLRSGNSEASDRSSPEAVFDTARAWLGVWHFPLAEPMADAVPGGVALSGGGEADTAALAGVAWRFRGGDSLGADVGTRYADSAMTFSFWLRLDSVPTGDVRLWARYPDGSDVPDWAFRLQPAGSGKVRLLFQVASSLSDTGSVASFSLSLGWVYVAGLLDPAEGKIRLYVDPEQPLTDPQATAAADSIPLPVRSGRVVVGAGLQGAMDELRIQRRVVPEGWLLLERRSLLMQGALYLWQ